MAKGKRQWTLLEQIMLLWLIALVAYVSIRLLFVLAGNGGGA